MAKKLTSALPPLKPTQTIDLATGEVDVDWVTPVTSLLTYVQEETTRLYNDHSSELFKAFDDADGRIGSANSFARQRGFNSSYKELPSTIKAKSRVNELVLHKLVSESFSYHASSNPLKQSPSFYLKVNLGAVDKQMAVLAVEGNTLWLEWKVWDKHLLFEFDVPAYVLKRSISKWSLPAVQVSRKTGLPGFYFTIEEIPIPLKPNRITGGVDLGRSEPFTLAILKSGEPLKKITTRHRLKLLAHKRERLILQKKQVSLKLAQYEALKYSPSKQETLRTEKTYLSNKASQIGRSYAAQAAADLVSQLKKHHVTVLHLENLKFATGAKYGSRWNHSRQQDAITHTAARAGITVKKVNPAGSSQNCHKCGIKITHNALRRTVHCAPCKTTLDRDYNAALNIAKNKNYPHSNSKPGDNCSSLPEQVMSIRSKSQKRDPHFEELQLL